MTMGMNLQGCMIHILPTPFLPHRSSIAFCRDADPSYSPQQPRSQLEAITQPIGGTCRVLVLAKAHLMCHVSKAHCRKQGCA